MPCSTRRLVARRNARAGRGLQVACSVWPCRTGPVATGSGVQKLVVSHAEIARLFSGSHTPLPRESHWNRSVTLLI